ncbi:hypothetical protein [Paenibacillus piri]|uniref:hypothetical protein n=1 Tax=Paenibacillus piri TaxID=2547395 RepID=UPI00140469FB|nr:hypothetical protein [Paenibacillus piri]
MRFVTKTRIEHLQQLIRSMEDRQKRQEALHILESIQRDIEENYAEIQKPIRLYEK